MIIAKTCQRVGCNGEAKFLPVLHLYADRRKYPHAPPASMIMNVAMCEPCSRALQVEDVLSDKGWEQIVAAFRGIQKADPRREDTQVMALPIDGEIVKAWASSVPTTH